MLEKFGYTNIALLVAIFTFPFVYFDLNNIGTFETIYFFGVAVVVLVHLFRVVVLVKAHRGE